MDVRKRDCGHMNGMEAVQNVVHAVQNVTYVYYVCSKPSFNRDPWK